jgi:LDH2 family malate/lactate/ureidoglycolate dehydrogenase
MFVLDMATSTAAVGKVEVLSRQKQKVPVGWGVDKEGRPTTDPDVILSEGGLSPLGGTEETAGYKGYGLVRPGS